MNDKGMYRLSLSWWK